MKVISYSLWGQDPKYCVGAIRNAQLAQEIFPDWTSVFHVDCRVPTVIRQQLSELENVRVFQRLDDRGAALGDWRGMFWRFEEACCDGVDVMISRDCDSRLSLREKAAVDEWLESGKGFHIMRDHPWHGSQMLGGMWGCRGFALPEFIDLMLDWNQEDRWQTDQDFLNTMIYPRIVNDARIHASFLRMEPHATDFPTARNGTEFIGQVFDEYEVTVAEHVQALAKAL